MQRIRLCLFTVVLLVIATGVIAQKQKVKTSKPVKTVKTVEPAHTKPPEDPAKDEKKVRDMVSFLGFMLNTLGSSNTSARDKDVLITESYSKLFKDAKVQVEDDLDEERSVITNKDVVAYLKDINFFFKDVKFEFTIEKIEQGVNADNQTFYKVSLHRNLSGTTSDGKTVNNNLARYIEINFNPQDQDLKIASIYTNQFNEKEAQRNWWNQLSHEWQSIFIKRFNLNDSVALSDIKNITSIEELNLSNNQYLQSFEPLSQLKNLKTLDLSYSNANDLTPIRNLTELIELNLSHTKVSDLSPLKYSNNLLKLNISNTEVIDITILQRMAKLQSLNLSNTKVIDINPIAGLTELIVLNTKATPLSDVTAIENLTHLTDLNISKTLVQDLAPLKNLKDLSTLVVDSTQIKGIAPLASLGNLKVLHANNTLISDLQPLQKLTLLEKIYCDQTAVNKITADAFMAASPKVLVVYDSHDLKAWWDALSSAWQEVISKAAKISRDPLKEELARVDIVDSLNMSGMTSITDLEPLRKFMKLRVVIANKTSIEDLSPIREHRAIEYLDVSDTRIRDLSAVSQFSKLEVLRADRCKIEGISPLQKMTSLEKLYVDETSVNDINAQEFLQTNPKCLLVYKTIHLNRWWRNLPKNWKDVIRAQMKDTTRESFHKLVEQEIFHFKDAPVSDLSGLSEFIRLTELHFSGTSIEEIVPLENLRSLKSLHASHGPIRIAESLSQLTVLEDLDISDTPIEDLKVIAKLQKLKSLNCSGTQIKRLDAVEQLESLESLDCSNTNVNKLSSLDHLHLKTLKCYNTKVSNKKIESFKASHPDCKVMYYR